MSSIQILSTTTIHAPNHPNDYSIDLTPWDLQYLTFGINQKGVLYHHPPNLDTTNQIQHLKQSLLSTLEYFHPLTGRLNVTNHEDNTVSYSVNCNNEGALFIHAEAKDISVGEILESTYLPVILYSFFPLNGVKNYQGTTKPLFAVQVTELIDGIFIGCAINHSVVDGTAFWYFINTWAKISKGDFEISPVPSFKRWFPDSVQPPIRFQFPKESQNDEEEKLCKPMFERLFHFSKENIAKLKSKANLEAGKTRISSLQAVFTHIWRAIVRSRSVDPQEELKFGIDIGVRPRLTPPRKNDYFANAVVECAVTMKAGELLEDGGLGKGAWEMNQKIALYNDEMVKNLFENWSTTPSFSFLGSNLADSNSVMIGSSPWFDVYGNDFGWGKPVGVRNGGTNKRNWKVYVCAGVEEGSMNLEVCLPYENLEAIGNDSEFMDAASG
ncbi:unnamed protein product [Lathyrus sativus]|uniref:B-ODAP synthetase n=1 Tax=Lathyrus sativus TaxID=3860 RepID=UPI001E67DFB4|nr:b-ODAP synthetase [Lathyrus sativus]6ZBS_A Chain A, Beta ODAP Synthetase (BOS) [Lathyrus sativus]CAK8071383.1 unnamed protein product [Lathyrus sativus]